jgi:two-component system, NarL family, sensor histidine kinase DesK
MSSAEGAGQQACRGRGTLWSRARMDFESEIERMKAPDGNALMGWLLMVIGPGADVLAGRIANPWPAGAGLLAFCVLYVATIRTAFSARLGHGPVPARLLAGTAALALTLAACYGGNFTLLFILVSLCVGSVPRARRRLGLVLLPWSATAGIVAGLRHSGVWSTATLAYGTFLSGLIVSVIMSLFHAVAQLKATRQELARSAVAQERLRFSRDLHDLLGHTLSVIVVKSEAARRLAPRDLDAALAQVADIESVGRQALTEIREAVTGYREGSLATELDRARSALTAAGIDVVVQESGPPLPPQTEALLGWVVREGVTNVVRHSGASRTLIELSTDGGRARLVITDDGPDAGAAGRADTADGSDLAGIGFADAGRRGRDGEGPSARRGAASGRPATARGGPATGLSPARDSGPVAAAAVRGRTGTGLRGLTERLAAAGGSLEHGPRDDGGFQVTALLPVGEDTAA